MFIICNKVMWKSTIILSLMVVTAIAGSAQTLPVEKLFFAADKMSYRLSDTIRVEGRLLRTDNETSLSPYSRYLYLEMLNAEDSVCSIQRLVTDEQGRFATATPLNPYLEYGVYYLRAFTKMMCNFADATIPTFPIELRDDGYTACPVVNQIIQCGIFPQGGHLVPEAMQSIAVNTTTGSNTPLETTIKLFTDKGDTLQTCSTSASGWAMLSMVPQSDTHYYIYIYHPGGSSIVSLPEVEDDGVTLTASVNRKRLNYNILGRMPKDCRLYSYHQSTGLLLIRAEQQGSIDIDGISNGVLSLVLTDGLNNILSEVHTWLGPRTHEAPFMSPVFHAGSYADLRQAFHQTDEEVISVRFIPYDEACSSAMGSYITTAEGAINYESDLLSEQPFPSNLNSRSTREHTADVNAWLCSAHYSRLNIPETLAKGLDYRYKPEVNHIISGRIFGEEKRWKLHEGSVVAYQHSNAATYTADVDKKGYFHLPVGDYGEGEYFFIEAFDRKGRIYDFEYEFFSDTIPFISNTRHILGSDAVEIRNKSSRFTFDGVNDINEIVVKGSMNTKEVKPEKDFYGIRFINEEEMDKRHYQSFQELVFRFNAFMYLMKLGKEEGEAFDRQARDSWLLFPRRVSILSGKHEIPIYLDGVHITTDEAIFINMDDIATVEYLTPHDALARHPDSMDGVLEMTTRRFHNPKAIKSKGATYGPPFGISNIHHVSNHGEYTLVPDLPGRYLMIVDCLSENGIGSTYGYGITVE